MKRVLVHLKLPADASILPKSKKNEKTITFEFSEIFFRIKVNITKCDWHNDKLASMSVMRAVVVAQLVERLLLIPEVHGLNSDIKKIYIEHILSTVLKRQK